MWRNIEQKARLIITSVIENQILANEAVQYNVASLWTQHHKLSRMGTKDQESKVKAWADAFWRALQPKALATANALRFMAGAKAKKIDEARSFQRLESVPWRVWDRHVLQGKTHQACLLIR